MFQDKIKNEIEIQDLKTKILSVETEKNYRLVDNPEKSKENIATFNKLKEELFITKSEFSKKEKEVHELTQKLKHTETHMLQQLEKKVDNVIKLAAIKSDSGSNLLSKFESITLWFKNQQKKDK